MSVYDNPKFEEFLKDEQTKIDAEPKKESQEQHRGTQELTSVPGREFDRAAWSNLFDTDDASVLTEKLERLEKGGTTILQVGDQAYNVQEVKQIVSSIPQLAEIESYYNLRAALVKSKVADEKISYMSEKSFLECMMACVKKYRGGSYPADNAKTGDLTAPPGVKI